MSNIGLFVDISNLYYCIGKKFEGRKLDYQKLLGVGSEFGHIQRAHAYGTQMAEEALPFITCLKKLGYDTKYKRPRILDTQAGEEKRIRKADWDVGLAMDVVRLIERVDTVIICSSDPDLTPLVQWVKDQGVRCVILACGVSRELRETADQFFEIGEPLLEPVKENYAA